MIIEQGSGELEKYFGKLISDGEDGIKIETFSAFETHCSKYFVILKEQVQ